MDKAMDAGSMLQNGSLERYVEQYIEPRVIRDGRTSPVDLRLCSNLNQLLSSGGLNGEIEKWIGRHCMLLTVDMADSSTDFLRLDRELTSLFESHNLLVYESGCRMNYVISCDPEQLEDFEEKLKELVEGPYRALKKRFCLSGPWPSSRMGEAVGLLEYNVEYFRFRTDREGELNYFSPRPGKISLSSPHKMELSAMIERIVPAFKYQDKRAIDVLSDDLVDQFLAETNPFIFWTKFYVFMIFSEIYEVLYRKKLIEAVPDDNEKNLEKTFIFGDIRSEAELRRTVKNQTQIIMGMVSCHNEKKNRLVNEQIKKYISDNLEDPNLNSLQIGQKFGMPEGYLKDLFYSSNGMTISSYIRKQRIEHIKVLLDTTDMKIEDILAVSGFGSRSTMLRSFKKSVGMTFNEYRKVSRKDRIFQYEDEQEDDEE